MKTDKTLILKNDDPKEALKELQNVLYEEMVKRKLRFEKVVDEDGDPVLNIDRYNDYIRRNQDLESIEESLMPYSYYSMWFRRDNEN